jgi:hypothetical protein
MRSKCHAYSIIAPFVTNNYGLEIGGPSRLFRKGGLIPIYDRCRTIDSCNLTHQTIWSDPAAHRRLCPDMGKQYVGEATDLSGILNISIERPYHIIGVAQKVDPAEHEPVRLYSLKVRANAGWTNRDPLRKWGPASASKSADPLGRSAV